MRGFTLIEALITLTVFTIGIIGAFSFALTNADSVRDNLDRYVAANLAREGLEIIKNVRDSNWLKIDANEDCDSAGGIQLCTWDQSLGFGFYVTDYNTYYPPTRLSGVSSVNVDYFGAPQRLYIDPANNDFYAHAVTTAPTNIYRTLQLNSICLDTGNGSESVVVDSGCIGGDMKIGVQAIAHLHWQRGGRTGSLVMTENLYNWRK